jgi:hypothetical protein
MDWEVKYTGPKPLNENGSVHKCMPRGGVKQYKKIYGDPILDNCNASKEFYDFLKRRVIRVSSFHSKR